MTAKDALSFVKSRGNVLESARGTVPNLAEAVAGSRIRSSWWGHPKGHDIFAATRAVRDWTGVLVYRLLGGNVTYIHRRLWPAFLRFADKLNTTLLAASREEHTASGSRQVVETPFPEWVPISVKNAAGRLTKKEALSQLGEQLVGSLGLEVTWDKRRR